MSIDFVAGADVPLGVGLNGFRDDQTFMGITGVGHARHDLQRALFGVETSDDMADAQFLAVLKWLNLGKWGDSRIDVPDPTSVTEARAVVQAHRETAMIGETSTGEINTGENVLEPRFEGDTYDSEMS